MQRRAGAALKTALGWRHYNGVLMPKIIISYRRADSGVITGRIRDRLVQHYGDDAIFMDIDNIPFGMDFRKNIAEALAKNELMLAVIGPDWLGAMPSGLG